MTKYDYLIGKLCEDDKGLFFIIDVTPSSKTVVNGVRASYAGVKIFWINPEKMTEIHDFNPLKDYVDSLNVLG